MTDNGIRTLREEIDGMVGSITESELGSRPVSIAITNLQGARMWLGECLQELGLSSPYEDSLDPTNENIAPEADTYRETLEGKPANGSPITYVKELRVSIVKFNEKVRQEVVNGESNRRFYQIAMLQAYVHLCNARMWLGKELDRIDRASGQQ